MIFDLRLELVSPLSALRGWSWLRVYAISNRFVCNEIIQKAFELNLQNFVIGEPFYLHSNLNLMYDEHKVYESQVKVAVYYKNNGWLPLSADQFFEKQHDADFGRQE